MKLLFTAAKWLAAGAAVLIAGVAVFVLARADRTYDAPYPDIVASADAVLVERGRHLFYGPAHCAGCHAPRSEVAALERGEAVLPSGGEDFHLPIGVVYAPNITPDPETGIGTYTDGELARALRYGVKRNGQAMLDFMPFYDLSERDLSALLGFLRSLPPVRNARPQHEWNFLGQAVRAFGLVRPMGDGEVPPAPAEAPTAEYGRYLAESVANCRGCHSRRNPMTGAYVGPTYAGQMSFGVVQADGLPAKDRHIVAPNLTPDPETGRIADWPLEAFIGRFRAGRAIEGSVMPWGQYGRMTDLELTAIYRFLKTLEPVRLDAPIPVGVQPGPPTI